MSSYMLIVAPVVVGAVVTLASLALMLIVRWRLFNIRFAGNVAMVALAIFVSYIAFAALGTAITARTRNVRTELGLGLALFAPMFVLSGAFGPRETFPAALRMVGDWLPLTHSYDPLTFLWLGATWEVETTTSSPVWPPSPTSERWRRYRSTPALDCSGRTKPTQTERSGSLVAVFLAVASASFSVFGYSKGPHSCDRGQCVVNGNRVVSAQSWDSLHKISSVNRSRAVAFSVKIPLRLSGFAKCPRLLRESSQGYLSGPAQGLSGWSELMFTVEDTLAPIPHAKG